MDKVLPIFGKECFRKIAGLINKVCFNKILNGLIKNIHQKASI